MERKSPDCEKGKHGFCRQYYPPGSANHALLCNCSCHNKVALGQTGFVDLQPEPQVYRYFSQIVIKAGESEIKLDVGQAARLHEQLGNKSYCPEPNERRH